MNDGLFGALALTAATVGSLHSVAPDHWVPFAAVARARGWSAARTTRVTLLCGFGHVTVSAAHGPARPRSSVARSWRRSAAGWSPWPACS